MQTQAPENHAKEIREGLLVPLIILAFLACAWLVYVSENRSWLPAFDSIISWIFNPTVTYTPVEIAGIPWAFLATIEVVILGFTFSYLLLSNEKDTSIRILSAFGLGFGTTGLITILLGIFGNLFQLPLNIAILLVSIVFLSFIVYRKMKKEKLTIKEALTPHFSFNRFKIPPNPKFWLPACIAIGIIFFFCFYHALSTIVIHWDAVVYHATMANLMYNNNAIPVIAGTSIGIQMSANFPPLFSALGAYYYIQIGAIEDFFLRAIPPVMGLLTVFATYKLGEVIGGKKFGLLSALFLALTPLFFRYSVYETSYSTLTFFCVVSILFLLLAITKGDNKYWISCGLFYGFALLTSYMALYLAPFFAIALLGYLAQKKSYKKNLRKILIVLFVTLTIGGVWYLRNYIVVGNPIYPNAYTILGGINIDPLIEQTTFNSIKEGATTNFFGVEVSLIEKISIVLTYRTHFPAVSILTVLGLALLPTIQNKKFWLIAVWPLTVSALVLSGLSWGFPHHMVFVMPGFALVGALPIAKALNICKKYDTNNSNVLLKIRNRLHSVRKSNLIRIGIAIILLVTFLFPSLTLSMAGKIVADNLNDIMPEDYLWFLKYPNKDAWTVLNKSYPQALAWQFMNENLGPGEKAATIENNFYYVKNCSTDCFFYLDGWEARQLYNITDPVVMVQFLHSENVTYIMDTYWSRLTGHYDILPLTKFLGSAYFPSLHRSYYVNIYKVGPIESPITNSSPTAISITPLGWSEVQSINGVDTQSVIAGNTSAKLYVAATNLTSLKITYLDVSKDPVSVNLHDPYTQEWINGYAVIQRNNTGQWKEYEIMAPFVEEGFFEFGFHAYKEDFTVSKIYAAPYQSQGRALMPSFNSTLNMEIMNTTSPTTLAVYVPMWNYSKQIEVATNSYGKEVCIEIFEGIIHPSETTNWWARHALVDRTPNSITRGEINPSIVFETEKSGLYTVVVIMREAYENPKVDVHITIRGNDTCSVRT